MQELSDGVNALQVTTPRRSDRKRQFTETYAEAPSPSKRKSPVPPTKMTTTKLEQFYMNKSCARFARNSLETIYEVPHNKNGVQLMIGTAKIKRALIMNSLPTKQKKLQRKKKIQRLGMKPKSRQKLSKDKFLKILSNLEGESSASNSPKCDIPITIPEEDCMSVNIESVPSPD